MYMKTPTCDRCGEYLYVSRYPHVHLCSPCDDYLELSVTGVNRHAPTAAAAPLINWINTGHAKLQHCSSESD